MLWALRLKTIRPDYLILGYFSVTVSEQSLLLASQRLLKRGISARIRENEIILPARLYKGIDTVFDGLSYSKSDIRGLGGALFSCRKRYGAMLALAAVFALFLFLNSLVWDVRVEGCESGRESEILAELDSAGLSVGKSWRSIDKGEIEAKVLSSSDTVSWLNVNRRGTVAYVKVIDKVINDLPEQPSGFANVVAERDCIIEQITVKRGVAMVKAGESVRKGQLLISGVIPTELGGGYCYAEGSVVGRYTDTVSVTVSADVTEREYTDTSVGAFSIKIFVFSINIFKKYRNFPDSCDIIERTKDIELMNKRLPIRFAYSELRHFNEYQRHLSHSELTERAADELHGRLLDTLSSAELVSVSTDGEFTDGGYTMQAYAVVRAEVGVAKEFDFKLE